MDHFTNPEIGDEEAAITAFDPQTIPGALSAGPGEHLFSIDGVSAVWEGVNAAGVATLFVAVNDASVRSRIPDEVSGYPVEIVVVPGGFLAQEPTD